jgi:hypothetical protein
LIAGLLLSLAVNGCQLKQQIAARKAGSQIKENAELKQKLANEKMYSARQATATRMLVANYRTFVRQTCPSLILLGTGTRSGCAQMDAELGKADSTLQEEESR